MTAREYIGGLLVLSLFLLAIFFGMLGWSKTKMDWSVAGKEVPRDEFVRANDE